MGASPVRSRDFDELWGTSVCDACGGTILLGQPTVKRRVDGRVVTLCSDCASRPGSALREDVDRIGLPRAA